MDTNTTPNPTPFNPQDSFLPVEPIEALVPVPARPQRTTGGCKRYKLLAVSAAIAAQVASGGLAAPVAGPVSASTHSAPGASAVRGS